MSFLSVIHFSWVNIKILIKASPSCLDPHSFQLITHTALPALSIHQNQSLGWSSSPYSLFKQSTHFGASKKLLQKNQGLFVSPTAQTDVCWQGPSFPETEDSQLVLHLWRRNYCLCTHFGHFGLFSCCPLASRVSSWFITKYASKNEGSSSGWEERGEWELFKQTCWLQKTHCLALRIQGFKEKTALHMEACIG